MDYKISVIVPGYNVAQYIRQCLDSLVNQSFKDIQVIMVDDGSPDVKTGEIMDEYASRYPNFQAVHQENQGLGAARNTGVRYAEGEYIAFVDSDDYLNPDAFRIMYGMVEHTGSDIVSGGVHRFNSKKNVNSWLHSRAIRDTREKTHITEDPFLLYDTTAWNKLYKRSFWNENHLSFPTGMLYEDIPVTIPAHFLAKSVDIVEDTVYYWRMRESNDGSITQKRNDLKNFQDRLKALHLLNTFMHEHHASREIIEANQLKYLSVDFLIYLKDLKFADSNYILAFQSLLATELKKVNPDLFKLLPARWQLAYRFVLENKMDEVLKMIKIGKKKNLNVKPYRKNGHWYKHFKTSELTNASPVVVDDALKAVAKVHHVKWQNDKFLEVSGHAYIEGIDSKFRSQVVMTGTLVNVDNHQKVNLPVTIAKDRSITRKWGTVKIHRFNPLTRVYNYNWSTFKIAINTDEVLEILKEGRWAVYINVRVQGISKSIRLGSPVRGSNEAGFKIKDGLAWKVGYNGGWQLAVDVLKPEVWITDAEISNRQLILSGKTNGDIAKILLNYFNPDLNKSATYIPELKINKANETCKIIISDDKLGTLKFQEQGWMINYLRPGETVGHPVAGNMPQSNTILNGVQRHLLLEQSNDGTLTVFPSSYRHPLLHKINFSGDSVYLEITFPESHGENLTEISSKRLLFEPERSGPAVIYDLEKSICSENSGFSQLSLKLFDKNHHFKMFGSGRWNLYMEIVGTDVNEHEHAVKIPVLTGDAFLTESNSRFFFDRLTFTAKSGDHGSLYFRTHVNWDLLDRSSRSRKFVKWYLYALMRLLPIKKHVIVFESLWGRAFNDNPKSIYDYMSEKFGRKYKYVWFLNNEYTPVPDDVIAVRKNSWRYFYYLARGKYFVENTNFPNFYVKRKGQIEMQTLHGTFMKTMGLDEKVTFNTKWKQESLLKRSGRWDYLVSPSPYMTKTATSAFMFQHQVVECGFPRNDVLYKHNNPDFIAQVKQEMNLPLDKKIILYAPTFRSKDKFELQLDFDQLRERLSDHYILLLRLHYFVASRINVEAYKGFVYDVSSYPDIQNLYLISDMMITDYSSVMFDYAHLKRPMLFFAYDLEFYRDDLRGMYLNYEETVPGPIVRSTEEIIRQIQDPELAAKYHDKYVAFYNKFCTFGRGDSAKKAAEQLLSPNIQLQPGEPFIREYIRKKFRFVYPSLFRRAGMLPHKPKTVLFESFFGQQYSDNPRAIYEYMKKNYPDYHLIWNVKNGYEEIFKRERVPYVIKYSYRGIMQWARAKYWVTNSRWPLWLPKPKGTVYVQTWHGTPLKTLGADIQHITMPGMTLAKYHSQFTAEARKWDYCVAPNPYSSKIFKRAFEVQGQMINSGYPRNDLLYQKNNQHDISLIKEKLGIPQDKQVILYAPTWRDNEYKKIDHYTFDLKLDLERMRNTFGKDTVLLMRMHYLIAEQMDLSGYKDFAIDVSDYEDIRELYLVSDCLITDYSSVFFDYANLKRPIVFYAYDLDDYANEIRGFYFDFQKEAPGPIVKNMDHLIPSVKKALAYDGDNPYPEFYNKFCQWEDGHSTERVVKTFLQDKH